MLILTIIIPTIIYVAKNVIQPIETAEIEKQEESYEEKISAASVRVNAGDSYTVPRDGVYKIELHGGKSADIELTDGTIISGNKGSKVTGYVSLNAGTLLLSFVHSGGLSPYEGLGELDGALGISVGVRGSRFAWASGGPGLSLSGAELCLDCLSLSYGRNVGATVNAYEYTGVDGENR